jgi:hypothetical protein
MRSVPRSTYAQVTLGDLTDLRLLPLGESVLFIGTQFSILYTFMYSPA